MRLRALAGPPGSPNDHHAEQASTVDSGEESTGLDDNGDDERYRLISIDAVRAPDGCAGGDWHVYKISQGDNGITGYRRGDLGRVTAEVETIVAALNGRRQWTKSKAPTKTERRAAAAARRAAK